MNPLLLLRTVRHLSVRQILFQAVRRLRKASPPSYAAVPSIRSEIDPYSWRMREGIGSSLEFEFLNVRKTFSAAHFDWQVDDMSRLWRYNLHYFDYLHEQGRSAENIRFLLNDWIKSNPPVSVDSWDSFPVSLRIVNWIKLFLREEWRDQIKPQWLTSLFQQSLWLERNIEYHLLANHYFKNIKALIFSGFFFTGPDAERWLRKGLRALREQLDEQILDDGGHFERSPMYHTMVLEDCLDLLQLGSKSNLWIAEDLDLLHQKSRSMMEFLLGMSHPDGEISLFNDAAFGIEASPSEMSEYYSSVTGDREVPPDKKLWSYPETGYYVMAPQPGNRLLIDCGPVGPDYQPGHAHCDTLSFELSLKGRRVIVDSGCYHYLNDEIRAYNRGNVGHNVVTVDGINQSEIWGAHRVGCRARSLDVEFGQEDGRMCFEGAHDGYRRASGSPVHKRRVEWRENTYFLSDNVLGNGHYDLESRFHVHPDLEVTFDEERTLLIRDKEQLIAVVNCPVEGVLSLERGWYCPEFGNKQNCSVLVLRQNVKLPAELLWTLREL